jgi:FeS assembly SUF system protein
MPNSPSPHSTPPPSAAASKSATPESATPESAEKPRELERPETLPAHLQPEPESDLKRRIVENVSEIYDPEIPVNVYDLGLIYNIDVGENHHVDVLMTLTAPNCPAAGILPGQVEDAVRMTEGVESVYLELTFDPPFTPDMMSEEAQLELGFM